MKINIRKCLFACMASMTLISFTAYGSEQSDQDQILREIAERIAASGDILDKIQEGAPWEDVQSFWRCLIGRNFSICWIRRRTAMRLWCI